MSAPITFHINDEAALQRAIENANQIGSMFVRGLKTADHEFYDRDLEFPILINGRLAHQAYVTSVTVTLSPETYEATAAVHPEEDEEADAVIHYVHLQRFEHGWDITLEDTVVA